jgi:integrase
VTVWAAEFGFGASVAREIARLTALDVKRATKRGLYNDGGGLHLQVAANGSRSWIFRYGAQGRRHCGLGALHTVTLAEAREKARQCRQLLIDGVDPIAERRTRKAAARIEAAKAITFTTAAETYINDHHAAWKNPKNQQQWRNTLRDYAFPVIGKLPVAAIDTALVLRVLQPIWREKPETASRVRMRIERILSWATVHGYRSGDNPARWRSHLDHLLPAQDKIAPVQHHAALPYADIPDFIRDLRERDGFAAEALEFLILAAARTSEVLGAKWGEFDLKGRVWTIPANRMKSAREHRVPLANRAVEILKDLSRDGDRPFPLSNMALLQLLKRMDGHGKITAHGFRSSFRDWCAETHDASRDVAEMALAHAISDKAEAAYRRGDLFEKRRRLMDDWASYCTSATQPQRRSRRA